MSKESQLIKAWSSSYKVTWQTLTRNVRKKTKAWPQYKLSVLRIFRLKQLNNSGKYLKMPTTGLEEEEEEEEEEDEGKVR